MSKSELVSNRKEAARLAARRGSDADTEILLGLLDDAHDTAVIDEAAQIVLEERGEFGAYLILRVKGSNIRIWLCSAVW